MQIQENGQTTEHDEGKLCLLGFDGNAILDEVVLAIFLEFFVHNGFDL